MFQLKSVESSPIASTWAAFGSVRSSQSPPPPPVVSSAHAHPPASVHSKSWPSTQPWRSVSPSLPTSSPEADDVPPAPSFGASVSASASIFPVERVITSFPDPAVIVPPMSVLPPVKTSKLVKSKRLVPAVVPAKTVSQPVPISIAFAVMVPLVSVWVKLPMFRALIRPVSVLAFCVAVNASISMTL